MPYRLGHTLLAAYLTTALVVGGAAAWHMLKDRREKRDTTEGTRIMFSMAMWMAALVAPVQILAGDMHGLNTLEHQPMKIAAMEGHYRSHPGPAPLILLGLPDDAEQTMHAAIEVPKAGSLILKHDLTSPVAGLDAVSRADRPPVEILFWSFRLMVGIGFGMFALGLWSLWARWRGTLYSSPWLHRFAVLMGPMGFVAVIAGWVTTEVGRQPYTVYGLLRTADSASPLAAPAVAASLAAFAIVYFFVFGVGTWFIIRLLGHEPHPGESGVPQNQTTRTAGITPAPQHDPSVMSPAE
jgi:cytochrome d ubiquinol oxidase subunit I